MVPKRIADKSPQSAKARHLEISDVIEGGVSSLATENGAEGHMVIPGRFVDKIRHVGTPMAKCKSRFVTAAFLDKMHHHWIIPTLHTLPA